jgi:hypothetical protein
MWPKKTEEYRDLWQKVFLALNMRMVYIRVLAGWGKGPARLVGLE